MSKRGRVITHPAVKTVIALQAVILLQRQLTQLGHWPPCEEAVPLLSPFNRVDAGTFALPLQGQPLILQPLLEPVVHIAAVARTNLGIGPLGPVLLVEPLQLVDVVDIEHFAPAMLRDDVHAGEVVAGRVLGFARSNHPVLEQLADVLTHRAFSSRDSASGRRSWPEIRGVKSVLRSSAVVKAARLLSTIRA
ncbi:hypothetical protein D3C80_1164970 [compost metagenome]